MLPQSDQDITALLREVSHGKVEAASQLAERVYSELHRIAVNAMRSEVRGHTLRPTELVHEAFMRLTHNQSIDWQSRAHFFATAATTIRRILIDHARARKARKRDHGLLVTMDNPSNSGTLDPLDLLALDEALQELDAIAPRQGKVVELRFFGGLDINEIAQVLVVSPATVKRDWIFARAFLLNILDQD